MTLAQAILLLGAQVLFPWQQEWVRAWFTHRWIGILGGRQIGKDYTLAFLMALELVTRHDTEWVVISATRDHAKAFLRDVRRWYFRFKRLAATLGAPFPTLEVESAFELVSSWGVTVAVASGTVRSLTGRRGGVILNEMPLIPEASLLFDSAYAQVEMAIDLGKPSRLVCVGNASFVGTHWHDWWHTREQNPGDWHLIREPWSSTRAQLGWSQEQIAEKRAKILANLGGNEAGFNQWFECDWRSPEGAIFDPDLLSRASYDESDLMDELEAGTRLNRFRQTLGYDVGRVNDPSAFSRLILDSDGQGRALPVEEEHAMPFPAQREKVRDLATRLRTLEITVDTTGIGRGIYDDLAREMSRVAPVKDYSMGAHNRWELFGLLKVALQSGRVLIPRGDKDLRMQLETIQSELTDQDKVRLLIPKVGTSHGDKAVALALATHGAQPVLGISAPSHADLVVGDYTASTSGR